MKQRALAMTSVLCLCTMAVSVWGQDYRAKLSGEVTDPSGASMPRVKVELTNKITLGLTSTETNESGLYQFQFLEPGEYRISVSNSGFKTFVQDGIRLQTGQRAAIDIRLQVGDTAERIEVTAEAAALDTESASRGLVANTLLVQELPIRSRNPLNVVNLLPGTTQRGPGVFMASFHNSANVNFAIS